MSSVIIEFLENMGFRKDSESWLKDYGNNVTLRIVPIGVDDLEIELNASILTDIDLSTIREPRELITALIESPLSRDSLVSLLRAIMDIISIRLAMSMVN